MISHFAQKSPKNTPNFLHIAQRTPVHPFCAYCTMVWYKPFLRPITPKNSAEGTFFACTCPEGTFFAQFHTNFPNKITILSVYLPHISCKNVRNTTCPRYTTSEHTVIVKYYGMLQYRIVSILVTI